MLGLSQHQERGEYEWDDGFDGCDGSVDCGRRVKVTAEKKRLPIKMVKRFVGSVRGAREEERGETQKRQTIALSHVGFRRGVLVRCVSFASASAPGVEFCDGNIRHNEERISRVSGE